MTDVTAAVALDARLAEVRAREAVVTLKVTLPDPRRAANFIAVGRRYGLHTHRPARQRRRTLLVFAPSSYVSRRPRPAFERITDIRRDRCDAITHEVVRAIGPGGDAPRLQVNPAYVRSRRGGRGRGDAGRGPNRSPIARGGDDRRGEGRARRGDDARDGDLGDATSARGAGEGRVRESYFDGGAFPRPPPEGLRVVLGQLPPLCPLPPLECPPPPPP
jgi:hypothetical protein